jgi:DNA-binding HxlR family transcriptional regulator
MSKRPSPTVSPSSTSRQAVEQLLGASRARLLGGLLLSGEPMHLRGIARAGGVALGILQRELKLLEQMGLIRRTEVGPRVLFEVNPQSPLLPPLRQLLIESFGGLQAFVTKRLREAGLSRSAMRLRTHAIELRLQTETPYLTVRAAIESLERATGATIHFRLVDELKPESDWVSIEST